MQNKEDIEVNNGHQLPTKMKNLRINPSNIINQGDKNIKRLHHQLSLKLSN